MPVNNKSELKNQSNGELILILDISNGGLEANLFRYNGEIDKSTLVGCYQQILPRDFLLESSVADEKTFDLLFRAISNNLALRESEQIKYLFLVGPTDSLTGRIFAFKIQRSNQQEKIDSREIENVLIKTTSQIKDKIREDVKKQSTNDGTMNLVDALLLRLAVDGYVVDDFEGMTGQQLEGQIFYIYAIEKFWRSWQKILAKFKYQEVFLLPRFWPLIQSLPQDDGLVVDISDQTTGVSLRRRGLLVGHLSFNIGFMSFRTVVAESLGVGSEEAIEIYDSYLHQRLSPQATAGLKEIFAPIEKQWLDALVLSLRDLATNAVLPNNIFISSPYEKFCNVGAGLKNVLAQETRLFIDSNSILINKFDYLRDDFASKAALAQDDKKALNNVTLSILAALKDFIARPSDIDKVLKKVIKFSQS